MWEVHGLGRMRGSAQEVLCRSGKLLKEKCRLVRVYDTQEVCQGKCMQGHGTGQLSAGEDSIDWEGCPIPPSLLSFLPYFHTPSLSSW